MGKYFRKVEGSVSFEEIDIIVKYYIANELAEANRLKRIQISHQYFALKLDHDGLDYSKEDLDKILEDQA